MTPINKTDLDELEQYVARHYSLLDSHLDEPRVTEGLMVETLNKLIQTNKELYLECANYAEENDELKSSLRIANQIAEG